MRRIYIDSADCLFDSSGIQIKGDTFHYINKVLRMKEGDVFCGFDGTGTDYVIRITSDEKSFLVGALTESKKKINIETTFNLHLFQSIPKSGKMDIIIRNAAQLGVKKIIPVISHRVIGNFPAEKSLHKTVRWQKISAESSRIAGRELVMEIAEFMKFEDAVKIQSDVSIIFWEGASKPLRKIISLIPEIKPDALIKIFVGPEGGYSEEEISLAENYGATAASIGKRILKVETASVVATALIIYELEN